MNNFVKIEYCTYALYPPNPQKEFDWLKERTTDVPPEGVNLKVNDLVTIANSFGVKFYNRKIAGFSKTIEDHGRCVHIYGYSPYWYAYHPENIFPQEKEV